MLRICILRQTQTFASCIIGSYIAHLSCFSSSLTMSITQSMGMSLRIHIMLHTDYWELCSFLEQVQHCRAPACIHLRLALESNKKKRRCTASRRNMLPTDIHCKTMLKSFPAGTPQHLLHHKLLFRPALQAAA